MKKILITGTAGFIGFHLARKLLENKDTEVLGVDVINDYYDINLKYARLDSCGIRKDDIKPNEYCQSVIYPNYKFIQTDIADKDRMSQLFSDDNFDIVINLAAQAGVRYSIENPDAYIHSNLIGFANILEGCRRNNVKHLLYASSSSVYGINDQIPYSEDIRVDYPISLYAATKKSNELMAHSYSHLYHLPTTGLRFFTVYGPWGRPDMALMLFTNAIYRGEPVNLFNNGDMLRDFTFIDDIVAGIERLIDVVPGKEEEHSYYRIVNIGNSGPVRLIDFVTTLEEVIGRKAEKNLLPMQPGDVDRTYANTSLLRRLTGDKPDTPVRKGITAFVDWYKKYYLGEE